MSSRAVFFAVHDYQELPKLEGVAKNVPALLDQLADPEMHALSREDCNVLTADGTQSEFLDAVYTAAEEATDLLLVYYAGHGHYAKDGQDLLLTEKRFSHRRDFYSVAYSKIREAVEESPAQRKVVIIDCCHSGLAVRMGTDPVEEKATFAIEGACVLASAAGTEKSLCLPDGSVFTLALVDVLKQGITGPLDSQGRRGEEQSHLLTGDILRVVRDRLAGRVEGGIAVPEPRIACSGEGFRIPLARNRAYTREKPKAATAAGAAGRQQPSAGYTPTSVVPQEHFIEGLGGFRRNLVPECLPYVSPGQDHATERSRLFRRLRESDDRGVLLIGAAGTGKTRTVLEVGQVALDEGWRVLHLRPGGKEPVTTALIHQVMAEDSPALVMMDYLNHYFEEDPPLDLAVLRHQLLPEAQRRGIRVAFLATARPGWLRQSTGLHLYELFDEIELRQDEEFQRLVAQRALARLAPTAIERLGMDRMWEICGHRPIIALLVAREVERRFVGGGLRDLSGLRASGELSSWLRSRLEEDGLTVLLSRGGRHEATAFRQASASELLVAAAAAAAACPQGYDDVVAAAQAALPRPSEDTPNAEEVVATLLDMGWLQREGSADMLATAHDIVCDQLVESVVLPAGSRSPDRRRTLSLLGSSLTAPRTLGRYATSLSRLMNDLPPQSGEAVSDLLDRWFSDNSAVIGDVMRHDADAGGYALGALVTGPPWSEAAVRNWRDIAGPWLEEYGDQVDARHLLHSGLSRLPAESAALLVPDALRWLELHGARQEARYVLGPLLGRKELEADLKPSLENAIGWLNLHGESPEAHYVLSGLVAREDLNVRQTRRAVLAALRWCERSTAARQTGAVLHSLLGREDLTDAELHGAIAAAHAWVSDHITLENSSRVLFALLKHPRLPREEGPYAATLALEWLEHHGDTRRASRVLHSVLGVRRAGRPQIRQALAHAVAWLESYATETDADFLIGRLLERYDLTPEERETVIGSAGQWLSIHAAKSDADFLIRRLLERNDLATEERDLVFGFGIRWLDGHAPEKRASFLLSKMLPRRDLTYEAARSAIGQATSWLELHGHEETAGFVLQHLLERQDVPAYEVRRAAAFANAWLSKHKDVKDASFVLPALLARPDLTDEEAGQAMASTMSWLRVHGLVDFADRVLRPLLLRADLPPERLRSAVHCTREWLEQHREERSAGYLLGTLLARDDLTAEEASAAVEEGLTWLARYCPGPGTHALVPELLRRADLSPEQRMRTTAFADDWERQDIPTRTEAQEIRKGLLGSTTRAGEERRAELLAGVGWLEENAVRAGAFPALTAVLEHPMLRQSESAAELTGRAIGSALIWLERHWAEVTATYVIQALLKAPEVTDEQLGVVVACSLRWLLKYEKQLSAFHVIELLLSHPALDAALLDDAALLALGWLRHCGTEREAGFILEKLLKRVGLVDARVRDTVAFAHAWLAGHGSKPEADNVLRPLLARDDLTDAEWEWVATRTKDWLRKHGTSRVAQRVLIMFAGHRRVGAADLDEVMGTAVAWLENHKHAPNVHRTVRSLFEPADLSEARIRKLAGFGLRWISQQKTVRAWRMLGVLAERSDLPADQAAEVESLVATRVSADPTAFDVTFVLEPRLTRTDVTLAQRTKAISWSFLWLERNMPEWRSLFLLRSLLPLQELSAAEKRRVMHWSFEWLEHFTDGTAETFAERNAEAVLSPLLSQDLDETQSRRLEVYLPQRRTPSSEPSAADSSAPVFPTARTSEEVAERCPMTAGHG